MYTGVIITESLEDADILKSLATSNVRTIEIDSPAPDQSSTWTLTDFTVPEQEAELAANAFASALKFGTWYIDMHNGDEVYVVFRNKIFKYKKGNEQGKAEIIEHARSLGIPESQLGWGE